MVVEVNDLFAHATRNVAAATLGNSLELAAVCSQVASANRDIAVLESQSQYGPSRPPAGR